MGASSSKPSASYVSPPLSEPCPSPSALVSAKEPRDGARGLVGVLACISPNEAAGPLRRRLRSALPVHGGDAKRIKDAGNGVVPDPALLSEDAQFQLASSEPESLLFSCQPLGAGSDLVLGPSGSAHSVRPMSSFKLDGAKHRIFLSHSGAQKPFVEQLCVDLEHMGYFFPFFDQRQHSLPKGEDFAPLIIEAARLCRVAVIVLSEEFLCSKWPMIELAEFYAAQQGAGGGGGKLKLLPLFFKLSIEEVQDECRWMPSWKERARCDPRIDLSKWSAAVKALCKSNGLEFEKFALNEVDYRKRVVESIFKLSPTDLLFGSFESMVGSGRMCEAMSKQFLEDSTSGARVLGIYGKAGLGKTMLAKALHDYFYGEFFGKVCYVDMGKESRAKRQKRMLKMLCNFDKDMVDRIGGDFEKGLTQMKSYMNREPVCLVVDNVTYSARLLREVQDYLRMKFHPQSRIVITASSKAILEDLLPNLQLYTQMPTLMVEEAGALFLKYAAPMKTLSELTREEHNILGIFMRKCLFYSEEGGSYHPMALKALADYFSRLDRAKENHLLAWKDHLEKDQDLVNDVLKSSKDLFGILGLQFSTFSTFGKLLFLDVALDLGYHGWRRPDPLYFGDVIGWLCRLHDESLTIVRKELLDLRKSGMINFDRLEHRDYIVEYEIEVPALYKEFARWYATEHKVKGLKNAWGVFQPMGMNLRGDSSTPNNYWSNLVRLRIFSTTLANARLFASKRMQELSNLVVLQLKSLDGLTTLSLEGLDCLRDLELSSLPKLVSITFPGNSRLDEFPSIFDSLQHVRLDCLSSLVHMPDFRPCTSLHSVIMEDCRVVNFEGVDCPCLKELRVYDVHPEHFERLLNFSCLQSLEQLWISASSDVDSFGGKWIPKKIEHTFSVWVGMKGDGPCAEFIKELWPALFGPKNMICTHFESRESKW